MKDSDLKGDQSLQPLGRRLALPALCFLGAICAILLLTWPWMQHFSGEFIAHWDPPFHAWKLEFIARAILNGDPFLTATEANILYPHTGTLYFEALQWPPAWLAAILLACTNWPFELIYHVVLVTFWALSAPCMYALLRELGIRRSAAFLGGLLFCVLPHRMSYVVEFQMQLIYAIPLFYLFLIRFFRHPGLATGIGLALAWWLQAVSELYEAVFVFVTVPFIALSFLSSSPRILLTRRFWIAAAAACLTGIASIFLLLSPYFIQRAAGSVKRPLSEVVRHAAEPLSYLRPFNGHTPWMVNARVDEFSLYPTLTVILLALLMVTFWLRKAFPGRQAGRGMRGVIGALGAAGLVFLGTVVLLQNQIGCESWTLLHVWNLAALMCVVLGCVLVVMPFKGSHASLFFRGLLAASILCFVFSLGPFITAGTYKTDVSQAIAATPNTVYLSAYRHWLPLLSGFRVVSRFGVIVLFFLLTSACVALDRILAVIPGTGPVARAGRILVCCTVFGLVGLESRLPDGMKFRPVDQAANSPAIQRLNTRNAPFVLAMVPMGDRYCESMRMFTILGNRHLSVFAWGGFLPRYAAKVADAVGRSNLPRTQELLTPLWPECLLLVDHDVHIPADDNARTRTPECVVATPGGDCIDFVRVFASIAEPIDHDERFTLMRLNAPAPTNFVRRYFRSDYGRSLPIAEGTLHSAQSGTVTVTLNEKILETTAVKAGDNFWRCRLDPELLDRSGFNELHLAIDTGIFSLSNFRLAAARVP